MNKRDKILKFIDKNIFITASEARKHGIGPMTLSRMVAKEELFGTERGVYAKTLDWLTDPLKRYLPACTLYPEAVISGISALTYYDLTDEEERKIGITVPISKVVRNPKYRTIRSQGLWYSLGIQTLAFGKRQVRIYDIEKTVVDAFKYQTEEVAYKAIKGYLKRKDKDVNKLCRYAEDLGKPLEDKVRFFLAEECHEGKTSRFTKRDRRNYLIGECQTERGLMTGKPEIYVSTDVEADGPIPGPNSMLSFGSAAYLADKTLVATFMANLETLPGAVADPKTMEWWRRQPEAWKAARENIQAPEKAMKDYLKWLKQLPGSPVFVGYPAAYDFLFVYWYLIRFAGESPFSHSALDIKTLAMALLKTDYRKAIKRNMPKKWFDALPHSHRALDDAIEQGALFCNMLADLTQIVKSPATKTCHR